MIGGRIETRDHQAATPAPGARQPVGWCEVVGLRAGCAASRRVSMECVDVVFAPVTGGSTRGSGSAAVPYTWRVRAAVGVQKWRAFRVAADGSMT